MLTPMNGHMEIVQALLDHNFDVNTTLPVSRTTLMEVLDAKADVNIRKNSDSWFNDCKAGSCTALMMARRWDTRR
jgi:hypothetical protein